MKKTTIILLLFSCSILLAQTDAAKHPWFDHTKSIEKRVDLLVSSMTLEEKVSQMLNNSIAIPRLGIPEYNWWSEALHGVARSAKATVFPQSIGLAATFDDELMFEIGTAISDEARAINNALIENDRPMKRYMGLTFWSPNVNIFRDPRWGRGQETYGEDPFLSGSMGAAFIRGLQGDHPKYLKTAACAKHFAVHNGPEGERHGFNALASKKDMAETYFPAFKLCVDAGVEAIMCAYNRTNDLPCCGSTPLLKDVLRGEWSFEGHIVSDCGAIRDIHSGHHYTKTPAESAALALKNGVNVNCGSTYKYLPEAVEQGLVTEALIDENLKTLLKTRFKLGMFDPPELNPYRSIETDVINSQAHKDLAREAAQKSIVLLQNKNHVLPLEKNTDFIYMCGPLAERILALVGNYNGMSPNMPTILEGIVDKVSPTTKLEYRAGALLSTPNLNSKDWGTGLARAADATIAVFGLTVLQEGEEGETIATDQKGDNLNMKLPENQLGFIRALRRDNDKPLIIVICAGSPVDVSEIKELADAILFVWYPGEQGGKAVADIIFGDVSPSGKLPITFPKSVEQLPPYSDYSMKRRTYKYMTENPQYPFGFGLSYANFRLSEISLDTTTVKKGSPVTAKINVENTGTIAADEVIQLYVSYIDVKDVPFSELKAFRRIHLKAGETQEVGFKLTSDDLTYVNRDGERLPYKGKAIIHIGNASPGARSNELGASVLMTEIIVR